MGGRSWSRWQFGEVSGSFQMFVQFGEVKFEVVWVGEHMEFEGFNRSWIRSSLLSMKACWKSFERVEKM